MKEGSLGLVLLHNMINGLVGPLCQGVSVVDLCRRLFHDGSDVKQEASLSHPGILRKSPTAKKASMAVTHPWEVLMAARQSVMSLLSCLARSRNFTKLDCSLCQRSLGILWRPCASSPLLLEMNLMAVSFS